jgi:hypothetical protein
MPKQSSFDWPNDTGFKEDQTNAAGRIKRCYETHPKLALGGGTVIGGNCTNHMAHRANVYVALDSGHAHPTFDEDMLKTGGPVCIYYPIVNMKAPNRPDKFMALIDFLEAELLQGAVVHIGCIGGHGRTGLVIAALVARLGVSDDPIGWVRENYCHRAIESKVQEGFLAVHFGAKLPVDKPKTGG